MGLDQWAWAARNAPEAVVDVHRDDLGSDPDVEEVYYWRKHPNLHGWMERLYHQKGGREASFNVTTVELTLEDLKQLEKDVKGDKLPFTTGFFFGTSSGDNHERAGDLDFISKARHYIAKGYRVFYDSWW